MLFMLSAVPNAVQADLYEDAAWIKQCVKDNAEEGQSTQILKKYCFCMVNEMPAEETRSVTEWEKANPKVERMCGKRAGWDR
ncbi:MAG: hypothetical protein HQL53_05890 [Magnetococcales bacterium]|nr:hypothetical protein [Magnetococcales bacterium]